MGAGLHLCEWAHGIEYGMGAGLQHQQWAQGSTLFASW